MSRPLKRYAAILAAASDEDFKDVVSMLERQKVPVKDQALLELATATIIAYVSSGPVSTEGRQMKID